MKTISVKQPWAYLLCAGIKNIENRTWKLPEKYKGQRVLIHASGKPIIKGNCISHFMTEDQYAFITLNTSTGKELNDICFLEHYNSAIIGSVVFTDCVQNHPSIWAEKTQYIVELEEGVYLTSGQGDPSRTLLLEHARLFASEHEVNRALKKARKYRPFMSARVIASNPIYNWVAAEPILFDKPIPAKGKLSFWDFPNINSETDEYGQGVCCCNLGIPENQQVLSYGNGDYRCKYCGER